MFAPFFYDKKYLILYMLYLTVLSSLALTGLNALFISFVFLSLRKWGIDEDWWEENVAMGEIMNNKIISNTFLRKIGEFCIHCFGFWCSVVTSIVYYLVTKDYYGFIIPFTSTPLISLIYSRLI